MKTKKFMSILLTLIMAVTTMAVFSVNSSAAKENVISSGKENSVVLKKNGSQVTYKFDVIKAGDLTLNINSDIMWIDLYVKDSNKNPLKVASHNDTLGQSFTGKDYTDLDWDYTNHIMELSLTYKVQKGTYYITFVRENNKNNTGLGNISFTADFPSVNISYLSFTLPKGSSTQMEAVLSGDTSDKVKWSSSDKSVATVNSKGKITAKAKGKAIITAKLGGSVVKIQIKVTE